MKTLIKFSGVLSWIGVAFAVLSCLLMASHTTYSPYAWIGYGVSSLFLLGWAIGVKHHAQILLNTVFLVANLIGVIRWLL